jgi:hypothetical protein
MIHDRHRATPWRTDLEQLGMRAHLRDAAMIQHDNARGLHHRRQAMRNHDGGSVGAVGDQRIQGLLNDLLAAPIQRAHRHIATR